MDVLYHDNHILVVNKPVGLPTESDEEKSLETEVQNWIKVEYNKPGNVYAKAAHRLDKCASGIVLVAKTSKALTRLHAAFRQNLIRKTYKAIVEGKGLLEEEELKDYLRHDPFKGVVTTKEDSQGKLAHLKYTKIREGTKSTSIEVKLYTGRYHQIRAQLSHKGYPILNDERYGAMLIGDEKEIALQHCHVEFTHPVTKEEMSFTLLEPKSWEKMLSDLHRI